MKYIVRVAGESFPQLEYGPSGSELSCFIPTGTTWKQLNYGQGEGQVEISGCEWGFYYTDESNALAIYLHVGECPAHEAFDLVRRIAEKTCHGKPFEIVCKGNEE